MFDFLKRQTDKDFAVEFQKRFKKVLIVKDKKTGFLHLLFRSQNNFVLAMSTNIKKPLDFI